MFLTQFSFSLHNKLWQSVMHVANHLTHSIYWRNFFFKSRIELMIFWLCIIALDDENISKSYLWYWVYFRIKFYEVLYIFILVLSSLSFLIISSSSRNIFKMSFTFERHRKRRFVLFLIMFETLEEFEYELLVFRDRVLKKYSQHVSKASHL